LHCQGTVSKGEFYYLIHEHIRQVASDTPSREQLGLVIRRDEDLKPYTYRRLGYDHPLVIPILASLDRKVFSTGNENPSFPSGTRLSPVFKQLCMYPNRRLRGFFSIGALRSRPTAWFR
jgi:hypothetical protein